MLEVGPPKGRNRFSRVRTKLYPGPNTENFGGLFKNVLKLLIISKIIQKCNFLKFFLFTWHYGENKGIITELLYCGFGAGAPNVENFNKSIEILLGKLQKVNPFSKT